MKTAVQHYGLHTDEDGILWLLQGRNSKNLNGYGLPSDDCPFEINVRQRGCYHAFDLGNVIPDHNLVTFYRLYKKSELLKLMAPIPYKSDVKVVYVNCTSHDQFLTLYQILSLSVPTVAPGEPLSNFTPSLWEKIDNRINNSNLGKYLLFNAKNSLFTHAEVAAERTIGINGRLIIAGEKRPFYGWSEKMLQIVDFDEVLNKLLASFSKPNQLQQLGNTIMKEYLRGNKGT